MSQPRSTAIRDQAGRGAAQPVGILRAGRGLVHRERAHEVVDLLRGGQERPGLGLRRRRVGPERQVLLLDRRGHGGVDALAARVLGRHVALEVAELGHQHGALVGLRPARGVAGRRGRGRVGRKPLGQVRDARPQALALVGHGAEALVEDDRVEAGVESREPGLAVDLEAEGGVLQARVEDVLVAAADDLGVGRVAVGDAQEEREEPTRGVLQGEVPLMPLHGRDQDPGRQLHVAVVDATGDHAGPLDQEDDLLEHPARIAPGAAQLGGRVVEAGHDLGPAVVVARHHRHGPQRGAVVRGRPDRRRAAQEAVPLADVPGREAVQLEGHGALVDLGHDPAHRPGEAQARAVAPAHGLREAQAGHQALGHLGHQLVEGASVLVAVGEDEGAPVLLAHHQVLHRHALAAGEALGGPGRGPVGREGRLHRRAAHLLGASRPCRREGPARAPRTGGAPPRPRASPPPGRGRRARRRRSRGPAPGSRGRRSRAAPRSRPRSGGQARRDPRRG